MIPFSLHRGFPSLVLKALNPVFQKKDVCAGQNFTAISPPPHLPPSPPFRTYTLSSAEWSGNLKSSSTSSINAPISSLYALSLLSCKNMCFPLSTNMKSSMVLLVSGEHGKSALIQPWMKEYTKECRLRVCSLHYRMWAKSQVIVWLHRCKVETQRWFYFYMQYMCYSQGWKIRENVAE